MPMPRSKPSTYSYSCLEVCAGAGGQAIGLEAAGLDHVALIEIDPNACVTLRHNRPDWQVIEQDLTTVDFNDFKNQKIDLLSGGVPCPPFSVAGKQLGSDDERDLFPILMKATSTLLPRALMIENVKGLLSQKFLPYREAILDYLNDLGYIAEWRLFNAAEFGVPQTRYRSILIAMRPEDWRNFSWPVGNQSDSVTVGETLIGLMELNGWQGAQDWAAKASKVGPTLVGGSKKHGGADLGPTRAKAAWKELGVDGMGLANESPAPDFVGIPKLTVQMAAAIQGFPNSWQIQGKKTAAYRQVGNAFPPPVAEALGRSITEAFEATDNKDLVEQTTQPREQVISLNARQLSILSPESVELRLRASS